MTDNISRADAIAAIRRCKFESVMPSDWYIGMECAQDIVKELPSAELSKGELVSKADVIDVVCRTRCGDKAKGCPAHSCLVIEEFDALPSAETHEIRTETHGVCLISKDDAIEAVAQQWLFEASVGNPYVNDDDIGEYRKLAEELFEDVPSADAVQGEWIDRSNGGRIKYPWWESCECNQCGEYGSGAYNYCPNCGARMKGGDE